MTLTRYQQIRQLLNAHKVNLGYLFALSALMLIPAAVAPLFQKIFTDDILQNIARDWLPMLLGMMLFIALFSAALTLIQQLICQRLANKIELVGASSYIYRTLHAPISHFVGADITGLLNKAGSAAAVSGIVTAGIVTSLFTLINFVFYMLMMVRLDPLMTLIAVGLVVLSFVLSRLETKLIAGIGKTRNPVLVTDNAPTLNNIDAQISSAGLTNIETIKSTSGEMQFFQRLMGVKIAAVHARRKADYSAAAAPVMTFPTVLFGNLLLLFAALRIMDKSFTVGSYLAFSAYATAFFGPLNMLLGLRKQVQGYEAQLEGYHTNLLAEGADSENESARTLHRGEKLKGHVVLDDVTFGYDPEKPVLKNVSLEVFPGQRIAIIGKSGAGKSTLIKLIQGLYQPTSGDVLLDGAPPHLIDMAALRASVGSANQHISIFMASLRDNITLWDPSVTDAEVYRAATDAGLHRHASALEGAYQYQLKENGRNLSGGQKQRLEIARALLYRPTLVLFDEVTSSLDPDTADDIQHALVRRGCAVIAVTHVVSSVRDYDNIIVLEDGQIACSGTHEQLLKQSPYYASLFKMEGWMPS